MMGSAMPVVGLVMLHLSTNNNSELPNSNHQQEVGFPGQEIKQQTQYCQIIIG